MLSQVPGEVHLYDFLDLQYMMSNEQAIWQFDDL